MNINKIGFTKNVHDIVSQYAKGNEEEINYFCSSLADTIVKIPKGNMDVDTSDNAISFAGVPLSFVRDWNNGEAYIMTNAEALSLDNNSKTITIWIKL